ncbi:hypothetical protein V1478_006948 [Vespula squamosa]|uniref:Uncharacterized protein n=1 Tax=Vespula squamosa TaxID=30214 RepID=A0ABD2B1T1_VESSQ
MLLTNRSFLIIKINNKKKNIINIARVALLPSWAIASSKTFPVLGSKIRILLSLHVVTNRDPSQFQQAE